MSVPRRTHVGKEAANLLDLPNPIMYVVVCLLMDGPALIGSAPARRRAADEAQLVKGLIVLIRSPDSRIKSPV